MGTEIGWTDETWNPIVGCSHASAGCDNCYAERMAWRLACMEYEKLPNVPQNYTTVMTSKKWNGNTIFVESALSKPLHWKTPRKIFVCSMSDLFHPSVPFEWIDKIFAVMALCPQHTFQVLTKRPERMYKYFTCEPPTQGIWGERVLQQSRVTLKVTGKKYDELYDRFRTNLLPNVWLGTTVEHPDYKYRIDELRQIPAAVRFLSFEPLLADPGRVDLAGIGWVIAGGESGPGARPMHPDWARVLRDQCKAADVDFFFKQWGKFLPESQYESMPEDLWREIDGDGIKPSLCGIGDLKVWKLGKKRAGCLLDGVEYKEFPEAAK